MPRTLRRLITVLAAIGFAAVGTQSTALAAPGPEATSGRPAVSVSWQLTPTGPTERFRGLSAVSSRIAWVSGTNGTVLRTTDGGASWASVGPSLAPEDRDLQFRDIEATSDR